MHIGTYLLVFKFIINYASNIPVTKNFMPKALAITNVPDTVVPPFKP